MNRHTPRSGLQLAALVSRALPGDAGWFSVARVATISRSPLKVGAGGTAMACRKLEVGASAEQQTTRRARRLARQSTAGLFIRLAVRIDPAASGAALAPRLEQADAGRDRYVEALHAAVHRYPRQIVAGFARQATHAIPFGAEHPGAGALLVDGIEFLVRLAGRTGTAPVR